MFLASSHVKVSYIGSELDVAYILLKHSPNLPVSHRLFCYFYRDWPLNTRTSSLRSSHWLSGFSEVGFSALPTHIAACSYLNSACHPLTWSIAAVCPPWSLQVVLPVHSQIVAKIYSLTYNHTAPRRFIAKNLLRCNTLELRSICQN